MVQRRKYQVAYRGLCPLARCFVFATEPDSNVARPPFQGPNTFSTDLVPLPVQKYFISLEFSLLLNLILPFPIPDPTIVPHTPHPLSFSSFCCMFQSYATIKLF